MGNRDSLSHRMKEYYESIPKTKLMRRTPVAIRIDGRSFHTFTRGFKRPFDNILRKAMEETMLYLCKNIQGCVLGYHQSDEITLILVDYKTLESDAWFDFEVQKLCSIAASMATMKFNQVFIELVNILERDINREYEIEGMIDWVKEMETYFKAYKRSAEMGAQFDARCFNIPREEVCNLIYWRQLDAIRNSIQMVGQANFSHKQLQNKNCTEIKAMLITEKGIDWNDFPTYNKRGSCCVRRGDWVIDKNIPIFKDAGREYVEKLIQQEEF